jgi:FixJ family two-component response regulator
MTATASAAAAMQESETAAAPPRTEAAESWPTVFVVDDDECLRSLVGDWVEDAGFRAVRLDGGEACLALLALERPVAVILDLHMSGLSGVETLDFIRTVDLDVPVIAMTGECDPAIALDMVDRGADEFLLKPVSRTRLVRSLLANVAPRRVPNRVPEPA